MTEKSAWLVVLLGLAMIAAGCSRPLDTAIATANATADVLRVTHAELSERYGAEQIAAAKRVRGDRADPSVRAEQRDRVSIVRERWRPVWSAYGLVYGAWIAAVVALDAVIAATDRGDDADLSGAIEALRDLAGRQGEFISEIGKVGQ